MDTGEFSSNNNESNDKEDDKSFKVPLSVQFNNIRKEFNGFLGKHTVYETVPENTKVNYSKKFKSFLLSN